MAFSAYLTDLIATHFFTGTVNFYPVPTTGAYLGLTSAQSTSYPYNWLDITGAGYDRVKFNYSLMPTPNDYIYENGTITFPRATGDWGNVRGLTLWDDRDISEGNQLWSARWDTGYPNWTAIPYHTITSGCQLTIVNTGTVILISGYVLNNAYTTIYGGVSLAYNKIILEWIFGMSPVPYARTYDIAIGKGATIANDNWGRWTGGWSECQGTGYSRVSMATTDWVKFTDGVMNKYEIVFTENAGPDWGLIEDIVLYVHGTQTPAFWAHLATPTTVSAGNIFTIGEERIRINFGQGDVIT